MTDSTEQMKTVTQGYVAKTAVTPALQTSQPMLKGERLSGTALKELATTGGFAVDESTGDRMIQALQGIVDSLEVRWSRLQQFGVSPKMSTTATGHWVAKVMVNTATDESGLLTQLQSAKSELPNYIEAIKLAQRNYQSQDGDTGTHMARMRAVES